MTPGRLLPEASSLRFPLKALHLFTWYHHAGVSHPSVSSPRLLYQGENFTPVRNLAMVSCKRKTTTRFGEKSVCRWTGMGSACVMFAILNHTYILLTWSVPSNEMTQLPCKWDTKSKSHPGMKLAPVRVFSCKHPLIYHRNEVIRCSKLNWNHEPHCKVLKILWHHFYGLQECRPWKIVVDLFFTITFN